MDYSLPQILKPTLSLLMILNLVSCSTSKVGSKQEDFRKLTLKPWAKGDFKAPKPSNTKFSSHNALSLSRACRLVWEEDKGAIEAVSKSWGLQHLFVDLRTTHSQYLILGNSEFTILAYRATQGKVRDIGTVLKYGRWETSRQFADGIYGGLPPGAAGFREAVADCFSAGLIRDIQLFRSATKAEGAPLFITGHSLGGGLAVLTRAKLAKVGINADSLYVFGCPVTVSPVGDEAIDYRQRFASSNYFLRFPGDNVPRIRWYNETYSPPGQSFQISPDGRLTPYSEYRTLNTASSFAWSIPWLAGWISNHNLEKSYIPAIEALDKSE
ncbi:MAG: hypothetical protein EOP84_05045 [Verrucomicrobiaceae bacterium]|nr:MAG: hypothetical protein EOP84_05045 [Verrucomicrobiaceae bacterium]